MQWLRLIIVIASSLITLFCTSSFATSPAATTTNQFTASQKTEIQKIVHDYLVSKPEVLIEASTVLQQHQMQDAVKKADNLIPQYALQLFLSPTSPITGKNNGDITLIEFFDYQCGHCKHMLSVLQKIQHAYPNLRVVHKELPIFGNVSLFAAKAALAAQNQGKFAELDSALLSTQQPFANNDAVLKIATSQGLDIKKLQDDMKSKDIEKELKDNFALANKLAIAGTPAIIVGKTPSADVKPSKQSLRATFVPGATSEEDLQKLINFAQGTMPVKQ